MMMNPDVDG